MSSDGLLRQDTIPCWGASAGDRLVVDDVPVWPFLFISNQCTDGLNSTKCRNRQFLSFRERCLVQLFDQNVDFFCCLIRLVVQVSLDFSEMCLDVFFYVC